MITRWMGRHEAQDKADSGEDETSGESQKETREKQWAEGNAGPRATGAEERLDGPLKVPNDGLHRQPPSWTPIAGTH